MSFSAEQKCLFNAMSTAETVLGLQKVGLFAPFLSKSFLLVAYLSFFIISFPVIAVVT